MLSSIPRLVSISSIRLIATVTHAVWTRIPKKDKNEIGNKQDIELNGRVLYQEKPNESQSEKQSEKKVEIIPPKRDPLPSPVSNYSLANISKAVMYVLFMDVPIWTIKYFVFNPNLVLMFLYAILPSHVWFKLFPRLLTLLR